MQTELTCLARWLLVIIVIVVIVSGLVSQLFDQREGRTRITSSVLVRSNVQNREDQLSRVGRDTSCAGVLCSCRSTWNGIGSKSKQS